MTREEKIKKIARHYGYEAQSRQCIEEMAELTQAINKFWREDLQCGKYPYNPWDVYMPDDSKEYKNLLEEIADVQIMLEQMKFFLDPLNVEHIDEIIKQKLDRQLRRMEEENADNEKIKERPERAKYRHEISTLQREIKENLCEIEILNRKISELEENIRQKDDWIKRLLEYTELTEEDMRNQISKDRSVLEVINHMEEMNSMICGLGKKLDCEIGCKKAR